MIIVISCIFFFVYMYEYYTQQLEVNDGTRPSFFFFACRQLWWFCWWWWWGSASFIHIYIYILNIYRWHAHISHVPFFLLKWFKWVITVGIWTYVWNFVHYSADFLYAWLHSRLIVSIHIYFFVLFLLKQNSLEYPALLKESESFVCININKNKNRWILVDRYISIDIYLAICILFVIILSSKERSFCLFYLLKSIISFIISPVAYFYHKDYKGKKVTQTRSLVHIFKSMM